MPSTRGCRSTRARPQITAGGLDCQCMPRFTNGVCEDGRMPVLNNPCQCAVEIECKERRSLTDDLIKHSLARSSQHILHAAGYRTRPEACPTCFITRMRRRIRAASMSIRPAQR